MACSRGAGAAKSDFEAKRLLQQDGVEVDQKPIKNENTELPATSAFILRVGKKRFVEVVPKK